MSRPFDTFTSAASRGRRPILGLCLAVAGILAAGCSDEESPTAPEPPVEAESAVVLHVRLLTPDGVNALIGAFPEVPTGEIDVGEFVELGERAFNTTVFDGAIFTPSAENQTWTRWEVDEDLNLSQGAVMSVANLGVSTGTPLAFISPTQGFILDLVEGIGLEFNPSTMEIVETFDVPAPPVLAGEPWPAQAPIPWGDGLLAIPIWAADFSAQTFDEQAMVAFFDSETRQFTYATDDRTVTSRNGFVDSNGDLYLAPAPSAIHLAHYGTQADEDTPPLNGMVRIRAGETQFDPDFYQPLDEITGDLAVWNSTYLGGGRILQLTFTQPQEEWPENPDDWWGMDRTKNIIDMSTWTSERLSSPLEEDFPTAWFAVGEFDGVQYLGMAPGGPEGVGGLMRPSGSDFELIATFQGGAFYGVHQLR